MFRLFKAELKKIFLKPSIFVVTGLIILMLAASIFIYTPSTKDEEYVEYPTTLATVADNYNYFNTSTVYMAKNSIDNLLVQAKDYLDYYATGKNGVEDLKSSWTSVKSLYDTTSQSDYLSLYNTWQRDQNETSKNDLVKKRNELETAIDNFMLKYNKYVSSETTAFLVTPDQSYQLYNNHLFTMKSFFTQAKSNIDDPDGYIIGNLRSSDLFNKVFEDIDGLLPFQPDLELVNSMYDYVFDAETRNAELLAKIIDFYDEKQSSTQVEDVQDFLALVTDYYLTANYAKRIVVDGVQISGLSKYTATNITKFKNFETANIYEMKERYARYTYLFDREDYQYNYADPYSVIQPSNTKLNGYDYSYFALRLCTFFITIYIVVLAAGTIAGEQSNGTLKLLAIRPYGRTKLLSAKILATITIGAILIFVSSVASLVVGGITYGLSSLPVLAVFNATNAFAISPLLLYLIAMLTMFLEVLFYAMLSIFISTVFKSNVAAVAISILLFFVSLVINIIAVNIPWLGLIPFVNVNLFKYFGASFLSNTNTSNFIQMILTPTVFAGSTIWSTLIIYVVTFAIVTVCTHLVFKKRDIK